MKPKHLLSVALAGVIAFGVVARARGDEPSARPRGGDSSLAMTKFYNGSPIAVGDFPGRVVRLSCTADLTDTATSTAGCGRTDHALIMDGDATIHLLLPGNDEVRSELESSALQEADVRVHGKYYPSTGAILVNRIAPRCAQSKC